ncbi:MAG: TetM/TetW/TetO/TetS family tetracycline resistance ribosomal protection protein [Eubacterium coprostanoligenes]|uniref:translation factor GTPase family protein n=1 Tax=Eubacterium coprostanoligenes TaxID=290054 RepID=UPI002356469B|nr:TetM/TetW/TetO/TetS family tetracycline resistance ribosomal protection protein [Eubacterium coprostanoligenes]MCI7264753.1 TetM/TetW/TetO/TetS family tetracycline resistance ribosomal protection protein [Eubacterium coprostanoligenes]
MKKIVVGILAHVDSGKTTLSEAMLYHSGTISKLGRVDSKNSFLDTFSLERSRGITIFSKQALLKYKETDITLIDTPGHVDFSAETERTLQVLDYAILVISATDGVQSHTQTLWKLLAKYKVPCFIFVNKTDLDGADRDVVLYQLKSKLSDGCVDFTLPDDELNENIALCDDVLLEKYEEDSLGKQDVISAIKNRKVFPCMFGSALKLDSVDAFMDLINDYTEQPQYGSDFGAKVYKISEDKGQRLTMMKITGGTLKVKEILKSEKNINSEKVNQIRLYSGEKFTAVDEATAGTVCAVTGITFTNSGDGLGVEDNSSIPMLTPVLTYTVNVPDGTDAHTVLSDMRILEAEDPQLKVEWNERYSEIHVKLMGDIQLEVLQTLFADRFGINISFGKGSIIYKETIEEAVEGVGHFEPLRHYAEVHLLLKPGKRGSGLVFKTDCKEDVLDKNWQRLILTHLYEKTHIGVLTGSPITDMEIILKSGKAHPKHTEGGDFRQATYRAVRQGLRSAKSILLEPYYDFVLEIPNENVGRAMSDIQLMHGTFNPPELDGEMSVLTGSAPVSAMCDYAGTVRQYTRGVGKLSCTLKGYEPCHNAEEVIAEFDYNPDSDTDNTCDSVFCSKGAGYNVKWDEVKSHMHLPSILSTPKSEYAPTRSAGRMSNYADKNDLFALDKELMEIFEQTYGKIKHKNPNNSHFTFTEKTEKQNPKKMPKAPKYEGPEYLLVDGYNVIFSWDNLKKLADSSIDGARNALINILCNYQGYKRCEVIVVFDAYKVKGNHCEIEKVNNITVVYTKEAETADMYIEKASLDLAKKHKVRVVTSDALEQVIILGNGALRVSSCEFQGEVKSAEENIRTIIENNH